MITTGKIWEALGEYHSTLFPKYAHICPQKKAHIVGKVVHEGANSGYSPNKLTQQLGICSIDISPPVESTLQRIPGGYIS